MLEGQVGIARGGEDGMDVGRGQAEARVFGSRSGGGPSGGGSRYRGIDGGDLVESLSNSSSKYH